ncbi:hypothetical protein GCM10020358_36290 [Amorphoplanes nipponensis]|uniref:Uncharacterized protein n=1 Tax=Actinoplanes nipponensis TaxID=135950 RepID=A0A919JH63_9ACTN|nr:hypothetical protein [Actinoplanes nipponensis]GIE48987.1 hypothetical protein Ani05nite_25210 [Actinoplanes nipponensis]
MSESSADNTAETAAGESAEQEPEVFANRAERRAKGKKTARGGEVFSKGQQPVGRGSVQSPRQYGNRRSG